MTSQSRWVPSPASGLCASTRTMGISLGARWALAVAVAAAQGHGGPGEPLLLPGLRRPEGVTVLLTAGSLRPFRAQTRAQRVATRLPPHWGPPGWGAVSEQTQTQTQTGQLNTRPPASFCWLRN